MSMTGVYPPRPSKTPLLTPCLMPAPRDSVPIVRLTGQPRDGGHRARSPRTWECGNVLGMESLRATVAVSLLTLPAAIPATALGAVAGPIAVPVALPVAGPVAGPIAGPIAAPSAWAVATDKGSDLIAKFDNPEERAAALEEIKTFANKTPSKARVHLMKQVGNPDPEIAQAATEAVIYVGRPMLKSIKKVLSTGEFKGVAISESVAARIALKIDPTGKRALAQHLEKQPLTQALADAIQGYADPAGALEMMLLKAQQEDGRAMSLATLRAFRERKAFASAAEVEAVILKEAEGLDGTLTQVIVDASVDIDAAEETGRMVEWLASGEPMQVESALWSIGGVGRPLLDLAPSLADHITSDSPSTREAAHWALRRFAAGNDNDAPPALSSMEVDGEEVALSAEAQEEWRLFNVLKNAEEGVLQLPSASIDPRGPNAPSVAELGEEAIQHWEFAPHWITKLGDSYADPEFATAVPAWDRETLPSQIEVLMPTLVTSLSSEDPAISVPAGLTLIEWNVKSIDLLKWAVGAVGTETDSAVLRPIWGLLTRESEQPWLKRTLATNALADALKNDATELQTIKLLEKMGTDTTRRVLVDHFANTSPTKPWQAEHYLALHSLMAFSRNDRPKFSNVLGRRFLASDYRAAPLLALAGVSAHPALEKALVSPVLDQRMIAVAVLLEQGNRARALMPKLKKLSEEKAYARTFRDGAMQIIEKGRR